jgi:hypothetical protein
MVITFVVAFVMIRVVNEYTAIARAGEPWWRKARGINSEDIKILTRWCPPWEKYGSWVVAGVLIAVLLPGGHVSWSPGDPFQLREVRALIFGPALAIFFVIPYIASARRMPGSYADRDSK